VGDERGIREVRVLLDGEVVAVLTPTWDRPDVTAAYPTFRHGDDRHGWRTLVELGAPGLHTLSAQAVNVAGVTADLGVRVITVPEKAKP
jgi:hypothetical protein